MGKGGDSMAKEGRKEVLVDGILYDVTDLKHPGGSVIKYYAGKSIDATQAFETFHIRSSKARKWMESLPHRPLNNSTAENRNFHPIANQEKLLKDFDEFHQQLINEGMYNPSFSHAFYRFFEIFAMHAIGIYLLFHGQYALGLLILGVVQGRCGWWMHEGGHYSITGNINLDLTFQIILYGVGCGMSASWWRIQHNKHHSMPQKVGFDVDLNTLPLVCFATRMAKKVSRSVRNWIGWQFLLFPTITNLLVVLGWQFYLHPRHMLRTKHYNELLSLLVRYGAIYYFFVPHFGLMKTLLLYVWYCWVGGNYIFINFALSHTHLPVVPEDDETVDWIRYASIHTMNVRPGPFKWVSWWMSFLNFQIEHHLFPCMPQFRHPTISPRVKKFFEDHGLVYLEKDYPEAMVMTFKNLGKVGMEVFYG